MPRRARSAPWQPRTDTQSSWSLTPLRFPVVLDVTLEGPGRGKLAQLVTDHGLRDEHRYVLATVVDGEGVSDEVGDDGRPTGPGLDDLLGVLLVLNVDLLQKMVVDERALLQAAWHRWILLALVLAGAPASDDELVARLVLAGAALGLAPRADRVTATGGLALAAAVRVVDRVHDDTTDGRALALPPHTTGLAPVDVALLGVADLADGGAAAHVDTTDFTTGHAQRRVGAFLAEQLDADTGRAAHLGATTRSQLHGVDDGTGGDVAQRQAVAGLDVGVRTLLDAVALRQSLRRDDVALLAVDVVQQGDVRRAVGVVFDLRDLGVDAVLVVATEVDDAVGALVATTLVTGRDAAVRVTSTLAVQRADQRLLRRRPSDLGEVGDARTATTGSRRLVLAKWHVLSPESQRGAGYAGAPNRSMGLLPADRVTIARLVLLRWPYPARVRLRLP